MSFGTLALIVLALLLIGVLPIWLPGNNWGYGPGGGLGLAVFALPVLLLTGRL